MAGAVAAGRKAGGHATFAAAQAAMSGVKKKTYRPDPENHKIYAGLYKLYRELHDAFGTREGTGNLYPVMKELLVIRDRQRRA
jgi:L-ribulokinase